jgi:hypothetical protein
MTFNRWVQILLFFVLVLAATKPLGAFMAQVFNRERTLLDPILRPLEKLIYRLTGVEERHEMRWTEYAGAMLLFSGVSMLVLYLLQRVQEWLPLNPQKLANIESSSAFNTAASFTTNTNWQSYVPEVTMSYLTQMAGLAYHNFVSAAVGIALAIAFIRSIAQREKDTLGNLWVDMTRATLWLLLPFCIVGALLLVSQGVVQNLRPYDTAWLLDPQTVGIENTDAAGNPVKETQVISEQVIAQGPVASSAPVIREAGGDRSAVTGGTKVLSDQIKIRITSNPGETFLDRMISLVEGAERQKTPNEIALNILLAGLTIVFLLAVVTLQPFALYSNAPQTIFVLVSLLVCLIPTTIGGLLSAIGIAGMDRLIQHNVLVMSGRAVEAASDVNTLLLDKTGTITLGNRQAIEFIPLPGIQVKVLADAAQLSSLADETPEGRSIIVLAKEKYQLRGREFAPHNAHFIPFTAQTRMPGVDYDGRDHCPRSRRGRFSVRGETRRQDGADQARTGRGQTGRDDRRRHERRAGSRAGRRRRGDEHWHAGCEGSGQHGRPGFESDQADRGRRDRQTASDDARRADDLFHCE